MPFVEMGTPGQGGGDVSLTTCEIGNIPYASLPYTIPKDYKVLSCFTWSGSTDYTSSFLIDGQQAPSKVYQQMASSSEKFSVATFFDVKQGQTLSVTANLNVRWFGYY